MIKTVAARAGYTFCVRCSGREFVPGKQIGYTYPNCIMQCPRCGRTWRVLSSICPSCKWVSGAPDTIECPHCRKKGRK